MVTTHQKARIHTQNIKRNTNPIVKVVIKSQENIKGKKKKSYKNKSPILNKVAIKKYISIILLSVNVLNAPTNETDWLNEYKNKTHIYTVCKIQGHRWTESQQMEKVFLADGNQKKVGVAIFISDKTDYKIKLL